MQKDNVVVGWALIVYGLVKMAICLTWLLPEDYSKRIPFLGGHRDRTTAGIVLELILFGFATFTLMHGMSMLRMFSARTSHAIDNPVTTSAVYGAFGVFMVAFYWAVLYTDLPISKSPKETLTYKLLGLGGGLAFVIMTLSVVVWHIVVVGDLKLFERHIAKGWMVGALLVSLTVTCYMTAKLLYDAASTRALKKEAVTLAMIPMAGFT